MNKETHRMLDSLMGAGVSSEDAHALRRISMTLHRWYELECGDGNDYSSWSIERDEEHSYICTQCGHHGYGEQALDCNCEKCGSVAPIRHKATGKPFMVVHPHTGKTYQTAIPDREKGAIKRLNTIMANYPGLSYYLQTDPRGASLYILRAGDIPEGKDADAYYNRGIAVYK